MIFGDKVGKDRPDQAGQGAGQVVARNRSATQAISTRCGRNIIDNAIQAMDGHGTLTIRTMREGEDMIRVEICDDGPGIPDDIIDRIFTPFFTTKPFGEGTGLGLDLAWRIVVEKHHGNIRVESKPGDTRFIIVLPLEAPAPEAEPPAELVAGRGIVAAATQVEPNHD